MKTRQVKGSVISNSEMKTAGFVEKRNNSFDKMRKTQIKGDRGQK